MASPESPIERYRNLLFGVVAAQLNEVAPTDLARAAQKWAADPGADLGRTLVEMGCLSSDGRARIEGLIQNQLQALLGNASATLQAPAAAEFPAEAQVTAPVGIAAPVEITAPAVPAYALTQAEPAKAPAPKAPLESIGGDLAPPGPEARTSWPPEALDNKEKLTFEHPGRYTIKRELDRGGIGRILIAFDEHLGREVAIKELLSEHSAMSGPSGKGYSPITVEASARFLREARITGQLEHPGVVPVYELAKRPDGTVFYAMKLLRGKTLTDTLKQNRSLSERLKLLPQFLRVCEAMAYAHQKGVIHRDLKPQNVMIGEFGETVVLDWGLAKIKGKNEAIPEIEKGVALIQAASPGQTLPGSPLGTPAYMSPEQAEGRISQIDERADVWGLGAILYEMLTGGPPFTGAMAHEVMLKVIMDPVQPVREREPGAPLELCVICEKCLEKEIEKRYASAVEVTAAVEKVALEIFGPMSFLQVREERNVALEQMRIAEEQRALAEQREREARENLGEAYLQYGLRAEQDRNWPAARVYYAKALALTSRDDARAALLREPIPPVSTLSVSEYSGQEDHVSLIAFSPDGKSALSAGGTNALVWWDLQTGEYLASFAGHARKVMAAAFSPDGLFMLSGAEDHTVNYWKLDGAKFLHTFRDHEAPVTAVAFSPDGKHGLSSSQDQTSRLWLLGAHRSIAVLTGHQGAVNCAGFSPDGKFALTAGADGKIMIWGLEKRQCLATLTGHEGPVHFAGFSPDQQSILSFGQDRALRLWSFPEGDLKWTQTGHEVGVYAAAFSPDGRYLLSGGCGQSEYFDLCTNGEIKLWSVATGACLRTIAGHEHEVIALRFLPDGNSFFSGGRDNAIKQWKLDWDLFALSGPALLEKAQADTGIKLEGFNLIAPEKPTGTAPEPGIKDHDSWLSE